LELKVHERTRDLELEIQERRQAEEALQLAKEQADSANRAKSTFLSKMSHELRTPLNAILGFTQMLHRDMSLESEQRSYLDIISRSGEHLLSLINDVLDMSKIEAGKTTLNESTVDLYGTIDALGDMLQLKAESKGLRLLLEFSSDLPAYIKTDESKLRQVLINLLGNAIKFTQRGTVTLRVSLADQLQTSESLVAGQLLNGDSLVVGQLTDRPDSALSVPAVISDLLLDGKQLITNNQQPTLRFDVEDTGSGIAPDELGLLFNSFSQTETGRKSQEGSGLGLSISQQFVQLMGGTIVVRSIIGTGTIFTVTLPVQVVDASEVIDRQQPRRVVGLVPDQPDYRILVVEDRPENQELLVKLLTTIGFQVRSAANGVEALQQWDAWSPNLIWMDMQMPIMDGYETTRQIREREARVSDSLDVGHLNHDIASSLSVPAVIRDSLLAGQLHDDPDSALSDPAVIRNALIDSHEQPITHTKQPKTIIIAITASAFEDEKPMILAAGCDDLVLKPFRESVIFDLIAQYLDVRYRYNDEVTDPMPDRLSPAFPRSKPIQPALTTTALAVMPAQWIADLHQAALCTDDELVLQLLAEIPKNHQSIAEQLYTLVDTFRFDQIIHLTAPSTQDLKPEP